MDRTPEAILAEEAGTGRAEEVHNLSTEDIVDTEDEISSSDAFSEADAREERIELDNDAVDSLVNESQEISDEGIDDDGNDRG
jgi:N utilization substance protein A